MKMYFKNRKISYNIFLIGMITICHISLAEKVENNTFVATNEWKEVREDQKVPAGLHIRINLQTGKKEAKLLDESEEESNASDSGALLNLPKSDDKVKHTQKTTLSSQNNKGKSIKLSEALKNLPKDGLAIEYSPEKLEKIKHEYKTYDQKLYDEMRKSFKSDTEIIIEFISKYNNITKPDGDSEPILKNKIAIALQILYNLRYLVHQIDNALIFIDNGGLDQILLPIIVNQTHVGLRVEAMRFLGALTQNNPKAQIKVFQQNFGSHLSRTLVTSTNTEELSTALYAFGSLLRKFPHAQLRILSTYGTHALITVLSKECELKIKAKVATLISDIIVEKQEILSEASISENPLAAAQYAEINFTEWLQANSYCETMDTVVSNRLYEFLEEPDVAEYFITALQNTNALCMTLWSQSPQLRHILLTLKNRYIQSKGEYEADIAKQIELLVNALYSNDVPPRDEL